MIVTRTQRLGFGLYAALVLLVFAFPLFCIIVASLSKRRFFSFPYPAEQLTLKWYQDALQSPQIMEFLGISLRIAGLTAFCAVLIGFFPPWPTPVIAGAVDASSSGLCCFRSFSPSPCSGSPF